MRKKISILFAAAALLLGASPVFARGPDAPSVVFFMAAKDHSDGWNTTLRRLAKAAATDLGIDLEVVMADDARKDILDSVRRRIESGDTPDFAIVINTRAIAGEVLTYLDQHGVRSFLFNAGLSPAEQETYGRPREKLKSWIGQIIPDDERAGYQLARYLIEEARKTSEGETIRILAFTGAYANSAAAARVNGLKRAVGEAPDAELLQIVSTRWSADLAEQKYKLLMQRYEDADIAWTASGEIARGVLRGVKARGDEILVGGMDWTPDILAEIDSGSLAAAMGGHFIDVAFVLSALKAFYEGRDFAKGGHGASAPSYLDILTPANAELYRPLFDAASFDLFNYDIPVAASRNAPAVDELSVSTFLSFQEKRPGDDE